MTGTIQKFGFSVDLMKHLIWQYDNADNLISLIDQKQTWVSAAQEQFWTDWIRDVFDLKTANEFGLKIWSIILDVNSFVLLPKSTTDTPAFGFGENNVNFGRSNFNRSVSILEGLTLEQLRLVLQLRYVQLISRGTIPEIHSHLNRIFGEGALYILDGLDMTINYVFLESPSSDINFILNNIDILPRPSGVKLNIVVTGRKSFGFGAAHLNFNRGNFLPKA